MELEKGRIWEGEGHLGRRGTSRECNAIESAFHTGHLLQENYLCCLEIRCIPRGSPGTTWGLATPTGHKSKSLFTRQPCFQDRNRTIILNLVLLQHTSDFNKLSFSLPSNSAMLHVSHILLSSSWISGCFGAIDRLEYSTYRQKKNPYT